MKQSFMIWLANVLLACGWLPALSGCASNPAQGYSSASVYSDKFSTVSVPIFTTDSYVRDVEFGLTDAVVKEITSRTPYKVTSEPRADTILLGHIREITLDQLSKSRFTRLSEEMIVAVTIDFQWKDLRNGKTILERKSFTGHALFVPSRPSSEPIEIGQFAVIQQLARDIVSEMRQEW